MLRIGVNALYLKPGAVGGTEVYLRSLLRAMAEVDRENQWIVFANRETGRDLMPAGARNFEWAPQPVGATFRPGRILYEQSLLPLRLRKAKVDVVLNPGFTAPWTTAGGPPNVTVFHDLQHKRHPEHFRWFDLPAWDLLLWRAVRSSKRLISVSESTRLDLLGYYGRESAVVPHGVPEAYFKIGALREPRPFLLCVSTLHPHKNHLRLVRAFARFHVKRPEFQLVLAGMRGFAAGAVETEIARLGLSEAVRITGWIPDAELFELYRTCAAMIYPSTFEGFGMPVLEALAAGVPLGISRIEPLASLAGGHAAVEFDPESDDEILAGMEELVSASPDRAEGGVEYARRFTWAECARRTLAELTLAAGSRG